MQSFRALLRIPGARKAQLPGFVEPCLATNATHVPVGRNWSQEIKLDGYRIQAHLSNGDVALFTRRGFKWTQRFPTIASELADIDVRTAIVDGEIYVADEEGRSDFHRLQADLAKGRADRLIYSTFDLLYIDGVDLRGAPLAERRRVLRDIIKDSSLRRILFSEEIGIQSTDLLATVCAMKFEGVLSKRVDSTYRAGRQGTWLKSKCQLTSAFPIVAFVEKLGAKPRRVASLYLGRFEDGKLLYAGKAQTGFRTEDLYLLRERLNPYITPTSPLSVAVKKPKATWVRPELQAEVQYSAFTSDGLLRSPVYKGLRDDLLLKPQPISRESRGIIGTRPVPALKRHRSRHNVPEENILQLLPDAVTPNKDALKDYWRRVHRVALGYLGRRPLKLVRHVAGATFYHKGRLPKVPAVVHQLRILKREGVEGTRVWVDDLDGLLGLVDMDVVELHPWQATVDDIELADSMVFDLDPGPGVSWSFVIDTAFTLREILEQEGFEHTWPKLTGRKGLHVMVPLSRRVAHDVVRRRARSIAEQLASFDADRYTLSVAPAARTGRLFLDYLRNGRGTTAVGTYSPRATDQWTLAAPVEWKALEKGVLRSNEYTIKSPPMPDDPLSHLREHRRSKNKSLRQIAQRSVRHK